MITFSFHVFPFATFPSLASIITFSFIPPQYLAITQLPKSFTQSSLRPPALISCLLPDQHKVLLAFKPFGSLGHLPICFLISLYPSPWLWSPFFWHPLLCHFVTPLCFLGWTVPHTLTEPEYVTKSIVFPFILTFTFLLFFVCFPCVEF